MQSQLDENLKKKCTRRDGSPFVMPFSLKCTVFIIYDLTLPIWLVGSVNKIHTLHCSTAVIRLLSVSWKTGAAVTVPKELKIRKIVLLSVCACSLALLFFPVANKDIAQFPGHYITVFEGMTMSDLMSLDKWQVKMQVFQVSSGFEHFLFKAVLIVFVYSWDHSIPFYVFAILTWTLTDIDSYTTFVYSHN